MNRQLDACSGERFNLQEHIDDGSYSRVYRAVDNETGQTVAIKKLLHLNREERGVPATLLRQISILKKLQHSNIVRLLKVLPIENKIYLVFEYLEYNLSSLMNQSFPESSIKHLLFQLIQGMNHVHSNRYMHRDLKPQNILVDRNLTLKIADFGISRQISYRNVLYTQEVQSLWYRAPQVLLTQGDYGFAIDVWSIGCVFAELLLGRPLFPGTSRISQITQIFKILGTPSDGSWPVLHTLNIPVFRGVPLRAIFTGLSEQGLNLLSKMLTLNTSERITCKSALNHPYFNDLANQLKNYIRIEGV